MGSSIGIRNRELERSHVFRISYSDASTAWRAPYPPLRITSHNHPAILGFSTKAMAYNVSSKRAPIRRPSSSSVSIPRSPEDDHLRIAVTAPTNCIPAATTASHRHNIEFTGIPTNATSSNAKERIRSVPINGKISRATLSHSAAIRTASSSLICLLKHLSKSDFRRRTRSQIASARFSGLSILTFTSS